MQSKATEDQFQLKRYIDGDGAAFEVLYEKHASAVLHFVYRRCGDLEAAEEVLQRLFRRLALEPRKFSHVSSLKPYLFACAVSELAMLRRDERTMRRAAFSGGHNLICPSKEGQLAQSEELSCALSRLQPDDADIVLLHVRDEMTFEEIGGVLGVSPKTVASRYYAARARLREILNASK